MSILLQSLEVRHERRIRVLFTNTLAAGAFGAPAPAWYVIESVDGVGTPPVVQAAYIISGSPTVVELALATPLVRGALYKLKAEGVPATDASSTAVGTNSEFRWGLTLPKDNVEPEFQHKQRLLYGIDLLWNGIDYQETATGDLDRVDGTANVTKALNRAVETNPGDLGWDTTYGAGAREYVDSPNIAAGTLKGAVSAQVLRDPRVKAVKATYEIDDEKTYLYVDPTLISGESVERVSIEVPNDT